MREYRIDGEALLAMSYRRFAGLLNGLSPNSAFWTVLAYERERNGETLTGEAGERHVEKMLGL